MSHFIGVADSVDKFDNIDNSYGIYKETEYLAGPKASKDLAKNKPELAIHHADSISYFISNAH